MSTATQCPVCGTRFKASQAQLEAYHGMVRCGHCSAAFNAIENRISSESSPQLDLPIVLEDAPQLVKPPQPRAAEIIDLTVSLASKPSGGIPTSISPEVPEIGQALPEGKKPKKPRAWPWAAGTALLAVLLFAQAVYLFRVELAARLPGLKPTLLAACARLHCEVPLPMHADLINIESSNMEMDPAQPGIITLSVTLHNLAPYAQAYPKLELTLTDFNSSPVGRRLLAPAEYLKDAADEKAGLAANRESSISLAIDASALKAAGYRIFIAY